MEKEEIILGLDVSTKTLGCTLFLNDGSELGKILKMTHISPKVSPSIKTIEKLFLKKKIFNDEFLVNYKDYDISRVIIEAPLYGSQNINTVATLLQFNGMISDCVYNELGIVTEYISSYDARKYSFPELMSIRKFNKKGELYDLKHYKNAISKNQLVLFGAFPWDISKKEVLLGNISELYPNVKWVFDKHGNLTEENFDSVDSLVAILGKINMDKYKDCDFKIISSSFEKKDEIIYQIKFGDKTIDKVLSIKA